jgi:hypothetical protein
MTDWFHAMALNVLAQLLHEIQEGPKGAKETRIEEYATDVIDTTVSCVKNATQRFYKLTKTVVTLRNAGWED